MRSVVSTVLLVALAVLGVAGQQPFTIPLPSAMSQIEFFNGGAGDMYYTVGAGGALYGVNLTSKKLQFTSSYPHAPGVATISSLFPFDVPGGMVLVQVDTSVIALNGRGELIWVSENFPIPTTVPNTYTVINGQLFIIASGLDQFQVIDLLNGTVQTTFSILSGSVFSNYAILTVELGGGESELVSFSLPSLNQLWSFKGASAFIAANEKYLLVENVTTTGDSQVVVLDAKSLKPIHVLDAMDGIVSDGFTPILHGTTLVCELGRSTIRLAAFNILTGVEYFQIFVGDEGESAAFQVVGDSLVSIHHLVLTILNATSGQLVTSVNNVPYTATHTITAVGTSMFSVANLQGYTLWNAAGRLVSRNEQSPSMTAANVAVYVWKNMYDVTTVGASVVGTPI